MSARRVTTAPRARPRASTARRPPTYPPRGPRTSQSASPARRLRVLKFVKVNHLIGFNQINYVYLQYAGGGFGGRGFKLMSLLFYFVCTLMFLSYHRLLSVSIFVANILIGLSKI